MNKKNYRNLVVALLVPVSIVALILLFTLDVEQPEITLSNNDQGCISCHRQVSGMAPMHQDIGCIACHKGNNDTSDKIDAHAGMVVIPGNLTDADETCAVCHPDAVHAITNSLMTTNSGIVTIDRFIFGEVSSPDGYSHIKEIGHSAADEHLRQLCAFCHLGNAKELTGPITQRSRGGGCNACHLNYSKRSLDDHDAYLSDSTLPRIHPSLDLNISDDHCFGCHSRSGRISTNYQGYHETLLNKKDVLQKSGYRVLEDDRVFKYVAEDVHHSKGLGCVDCHGYGDVMGDGKQYMHEEEAVKISCEDCHRNSFNNTVSVEDLNFAEKRILKLRDYQHADKKMLKTVEGDQPILNAYIKGNGKAVLVEKKSRDEHPLLPPLEDCTREFGHGDLTCSSCHTSWAPQCIGCHVSYDKKSTGYDLLEGNKTSGAWIEYAGEFLAGSPTLGVLEFGNNREIKNAIPGMIMTLDKGSYSNSGTNSDTTFYRLFAPAEPHTSSSRGRNCMSCHNDPLALGYGRGNLNLITDANGSHWVFTSEYADSHMDGQPADSWIEFMKDPSKLVSTRSNFRPFNVEEQRKILRVGACLTCHEENSQVMTRSLKVDFSDYLQEISTACKVSGI